MNKKDISAIEEILHNELAKLASYTPGTEAVYKGVCPEEGTCVYYFLIPGKYSSKIADIISGADLKLSRKFQILAFYYQDGLFHSARRQDIPS